MPGAAGHPPGGQQPGNERRPSLGVPDDLADIDADERGWRIGPAAELVEGRLRGPGLLLGSEQPAPGLDELAPVAPRPVAARTAGHAPQHRDTALTDHRQRLVRPARLDLDPPDDCVHESTMAPRPGPEHR